MSTSLTSGLDGLRLDSAIRSGDGSQPSPIAMDLSQDPRSDELKAKIGHLFDRYHRLYEEFETYAAAVEDNRKLAKIQNPVEYRSLRNDLKSELGFLRKLTSPTLSEKKTQQYIASSNLPYFEALWDAAKRSTGLIHFRKYYWWMKKSPGNTQNNRKEAAQGKTSAIVDVVADEGREWVRVSTMPEKRLLIDLAKLGWRNDSDSEDEDEDMPDAQESIRDDEDDEDEIEIVRTARDLARAARANPIRGRPPSIHFILTRIEAGKTKEIDVVIQKIRATGALVHCANEFPPTPPLSEALPRLLVDRSRSLSEKLNIDCTILLALISDISHRQCPILDWYPAEVRNQILEEEKEKLLNTHLYPAIANHPMVCTQEAADQMNLINETIATDTEKIRADILLAQNEHATSSLEELRTAWTALSDYSQPPTFQLPIKIFPSHLERLRDQLPPVAKTIAKDLSPLNQAIFFYGWAEGLTTLSSNRAKANIIENCINKEGLGDAEMGPNIWLCGESRSLIAKQGKRRS